MMKNRAVFALLALLVGAMASACTTSYWELDQHSGHPRHTLGWSPKGHVVFSHGHGDAAYAGGRSIYAVRDDGSLLSVIQESGQGRVVTNISPEVSPDGSEIAYARYKESEWCGLGGHNWDVFATRIDGSHTRRLTRGKGADSNPIWSPDGERILFSSNCTAGTDDSALCIMNADGSGARALPWDYIRANPWASWSPDGSRLALFGQPPDISPKYMLHVAMADGSNLTRIMQMEALASPSWLTFSTPSWSPDGDYLVFIRTDGSRKPSSVYVASANGEIVRKIDDIDNEGNPNSQVLWSPNGAELLVHDSRWNSQNIVRIMSPEGLLLSSWPVLSDELRASGIWPSGGLIVAAWSPDGSRIAFSDTEGTVWTVNRDGTDVRFLVDSGELISS